MSRRSTPSTPSVTAPARSRETYTLGAVAMEKLAAVEGITFTPAMRRKIEAARDPSLTPAERRSILAAGLGKGRP